MKMIKCYSPRNPLKRCVWSLYLKYSNKLVGYLIISCITRSIKNGNEALMIKQHWRQFIDRQPRLEKQNRRSLTNEYFIIGPTYIIIFVVPSFISTQLIYLVSRRVGLKKVEWHRCQKKTYDIAFFNFNAHGLLFIEWI